MKKLLALLLTFMLVFSFVPVTAFAEGNNGTESTKGTITILGPAVGTEYKIYKLLDVSSSNEDYSLVTYKVATGWSGFFATDVAKEYVTIDDNEAVIPKATFTESNAADFATAAFEYADENSITPVKTAVAVAKGKTPLNQNEVELNDKGDLVFEVPLGYYLVDTSVGALCALTTTQPNANISIKNFVPTIDKKVEEDSNADSTTSSFGKTNSADIGQVVNFDVTIDVRKGVQNYVLHDVMDEGFDLLLDDNHKIVVKYHRQGEQESTLVENQDYFVKIVEDVDGKRCTSEVDNCSFEIAFKDEVIKNVKGDDKIYVLYSARINNKAEAEVAIKNTAILSFGDHHKTEPSTTQTFTYGFEIVKTDPSAMMLEGAEFQVYGEKDIENSKIKFYKVNDNLYRRATDAEIASTDDNVKNNITDKIAVKKNTEGNAIATIYGLDTDIYYVKETKNPEGYNAMTGYRDVNISNKCIHAEYETASGNKTYKAGTGVQIINQKGTVLPTTGGTGTVMFVTCGSIAVIAAGVLLITKKRMSMFED